MRRAHVYRDSDYRLRPWKNGLGRTLELAVEPPGADLETFEWRVSIATVSQSGPFSRFPGCERTLLLLDGEGFELAGGRSRVVVDRPLAPVRFDGGEAIECRLLGGPSRDFNVMTRGARADVEVVRPAGREARELAATTLVYAVRGPIEAAWSGGAARLETGELFRIDGGGRWEIAGREAVGILVDLRR